MGFCDAPRVAQGETDIRVRGLVKQYRGTPAVDGIDLDVRRGETFALLGPNGAGKTTIVEILEGYRERDGGEVSVLGHDPRERDRWWRTRLGIVMQESSDIYELTVEEIVRHFAVEHVFQEGMYRVTFRLKRDNKELASARASVSIR